MADERIGIRIVVFGMSEARRQLGALRGDLARLAGESAATGGAVANFGKSVAQVGNIVSSLGRTLTISATIPITLMGGALLKAGIDFEQAFVGVAKTVDGVAMGFEDIAKSMYGTAEGLSAAQKQAVWASEDFGKLTDIGENLRKSFIKMSMDIPIAATELARIGQVSGQLGIAAGQIEEFTKIVAMLAATTDLSSEQAAFAIARVGNIMGVAAEDMGKYAAQFGAAIVDLGNNAAATEPEIVNLSLRLAAAGRVVGMTTPEILGLSAALAETGVRAERGGTAVSRLIYEMLYSISGLTGGAEDFEGEVESVEEALVSLRRELERGNTDIEYLKTGLQNTSLVLSGLTTDLNALEKGTIDIDKVIYNVRARTLRELEEGLGEAQTQVTTFAKIMGISAQEFARVFKEDPVRTIEIFLVKLVELQEQGRLSKETLQTLGLSGVRVREVMNILGPNIELVRENIKRANYEWENQIALQEEFQKQMGTIRNQLIRLSNVFKALGVEILADFHDDIEGLINGISKLVQKFIDLDPAIRKNISRVIMFVGVIGPLLLLLGTLMQALGNTILGVTGLGGAFKRLALLPLAPITLLTGLFGSGEKNVLAKTFGGLRKTIFEGAKSLGDSGKAGLKQALNSVLSVFTWFKDKFVGGLKLAFSVPKRLFSSVGKFLSEYLFTGLANFFTRIRNVLSTLFSALPVMLSAPLKLLGSILSSVVSIFGNLFRFVLGTGVSALGVLGSSLLSVFKIFLSWVPMLGSLLPKVFLGFFGMLPKLALLGAAAFTLLFAPKVISSVIKNRDALFKEIKTSVKQFKDDLAKEGLERAILLFVSGGSTGSGREGGLMGISKALGASEEQARKFSYAMGVATYFVIQIVNKTAEFVSSLILGTKETNKIGGRAKSTGDRLIALANTLAQLLRGFFKGWTGSFEGIRAAFNTFVSAARTAMATIGRLFENIFGKPKDQIKDFYDELEPGADSTASRIGATLGRIFGWIIETGLYTLTLIVNVITAIADAFNTVVTAYRTGGLEGVFAELGPILKGLWDGVITAADALWDNVKGPLKNSVDSAIDWLSTTGADSLKAGAKSLWNVLRDTLDEVISGKTTTLDTVAMFTPSGERVGAVLKSTQEGIRDLAKEGYYFRPETVVTEEPGLLTKLATIIEGEKNRVTSAIRGLIDAAKELIESPETIEKIKSAFNTVLEGLGSFLKDNVWVHIEPALTSAVNAMADWLDPRARAMGEHFGAIFARALLDVFTWSPGLELGKQLGLWEARDWSGVFGISEELGLDKTFQERLDEELAKVDPVKIAKDSWAGQFAEEAKNALQGAEQGIEEQSPTTIQKLINFINLAVSRFKAVLGIYSPSAVFMNIGRGIMLGLIQGISSMRDYLQSVLNSVLAQLLVFSSSVGLISSQIQAQITAIQTLAAALVATTRTAITGIMGVLGGTAPVGAPITTTTTYQQTYNPVFYGPQPAATYMQERSVYQQYLLAQQAVG